MAERRSASAPIRPDPDLEQRLVEEHGAISDWMIDGARLWLDHGLEPPVSVQSSSALVAPASLNSSPLIIVTGLTAVRFERGIREPVITIWDAESRSFACWMLACSAGAAAEREPVAIAIAHRLARQ